MQTQLTDAMKFAGAKNFLFHNTLVASSGIIFILRQ